MSPQTFAGAQVKGILVLVSLAVKVTVGFSELQRTGDLELGARM